MADFEPKQFGKYYLLEKLAVGGMAEIYKAKTFGVDGFEKLLALKRILPHCSADRDFITMLTDEAKLSVLLSHANIVQVYDLGKVGDDYFISMEFINGPNLRDIMYRCRERGVKIPTELAVYMISEVCKGLDYAHRKTDQNNRPLDLVHRDVSPQNILVSYEGEVKIVDFGIAKAAMNISHTMAGILKGKIAYMSPEQALGKTIDHHTDIFSAGIVLYEILTQEKLFTGESQFEVLKKIRTTKMDKTKMAEAIPDQLKEILSKALAYFTRDRFNSAGDMQIELTKFLYQTYVDFSPQKLASFVRDLFEDEMNRQQNQAIREASLEAQTTSINIAQEALQENIVHREETGITTKHRAAEQNTDKEISSIETDHGRKPAKKGMFARAVAIFAAIALLGGGAFAYFKFIHPMLTEKKEVTTGTVSVVTEPSGAKIFLDGNETQYKTPAIVEGLEVNKPHALKISKEGYADLSHTIIAENTSPMMLTFTLTKEVGTINIASDPAGAKIKVDGIDVGKTTPAQITDLAVGKEIKIALSKEGYKDLEKSLTLVDIKPIDIKETLEKILYGKLRVSSEPAGGEILLDNIKTGKTTPAVIDNLEQGKEYTIEVTKENFTSFTRTLILNKDEFQVAGKLEAIKPETKPIEEVKKEEPVKKEVVKEEPVAKEVKKTTLSVTSTPAGADIFINGRNTGKRTPATFADIEVGKTYTVRTTKQGFEATTRKLTVANEKPQSVAATLKEEVKPEIKAEDAAKAAAAKEAAKEEAASKAEAAKAEAKAKAEEKKKPEVKEPETKPEKQVATGGTGTIKISSKPSGADVFINSEMAGRTPFSGSVPSGSVSVLVNKEGTMRYSTRVSVAPGETKNLGTVSLGDLYGEVSISSVPGGATVIFDGQNVGARTPVTVRKVKRDQGHSISVSLGGYQTFTRSFNFGQSEEVKSFNVTLDKE